MTATTTTTNTTVTFKKLEDGSWGIQGHDLRPGDVVAVTKRNGETSVVTVGEVMPYVTGFGNNVARIAQTPRTTTTTASTQVPSADEVPAGRYAVATEDGAVNELAFYKVDRPTEGRWAGYVFVKLMKSDEEQRLSRPAGATVLAKIAAAGAKEASAAYGREIGKCGVCSRTLTNDESREIGIGPDCRARLGW